MTVINKTDCQIKLSIGSLTIKTFLTIGGLQHSHEQKLLTTRENYSKTMYYNNNIVASKNETVVIFWCILFRKYLNAFVYANIINIMDQVLNNK